MKSPAKPISCKRVVRWCRRPGYGTLIKGSPTPCAARRRPTTTATSPIPTCFPWSLTRPGWRRFKRRCPNCRRRAGRGSSPIFNCRTTMPAYSRPAGNWPTILKPAWKKSPNPSRSPTGSWDHCWGCSMPRAKPSPSHLSVHMIWPACCN